jgi:hypothetical protein
MSLDILDWLPASLTEMVKGDPSDTDCGAATRVVQQAGISPSRRLSKIGATDAPDQILIVSRWILDCRSTGKWIAQFVLKSPKEDSP